MANRVRAVEHSEAVACHPHRTHARRPLALGRIRVLRVARLRHLVEVVRAVVEVRRALEKKTQISPCTFKCTCTCTGN